MLFRAIPITEEEHKRIMLSMNPPGDFDAPYVPTWGQLVELKALANSRYGLKDSPELNNNGPAHN